MVNGLCKETDSEENAALKIQDEFKTEDHFLKFTSEQFSDSFLFCSVA